MLIPNRSVNRKCAPRCVTDRIISWWARCAAGELLWEVTCRGVVNGIAAATTESSLYKHPPAQWVQPVQVHLHGPYSLKFPT